MIYQVFLIYDQSLKRLF